MSIADVVRACREKAGYSQDKMAELLNRTQSCISRMEQGRRTIDAQTLLDWSRLTNQVDHVVKLFYGTEPAAVIQTIMQVTGVA